MIRFSKFCLTGIAALLLTAVANAQTNRLAPVSIKLPDGKTVKVVKCYPGGLMRAYCVSFDDGTLGSDWPVMDALRSRKITATFFVNSLHPQSKDAVAFPARYAGFEIASHGANHKGLGNMELGVARKEIEDDQRILGDKFGQKIDGFAYPYGDIPKTEEARVQLEQTMATLGIIYARGTRATNAYAPPEDFLRWDPDCGLMQKVEKFTSQPADESVRVMMCFGHSIDFARGMMSFDDWQKQLDVLAADKTIWKSTMRDLAQYVIALRALEIGTGGLRNSSKISVYANINGKLVEIPAGKTLAWKDAL